MIVPLEASFVCSTGAYPISQICLVFCSNLKWGTQSKSFLSQSISHRLPTSTFLSLHRVLEVFEMFVMHDLPCLKSCDLVLKACCVSAYLLGITFITRFITVTGMLVIVTSQQLLRFTLTPFVT